jgi:hypothetical protein
MSLYKFKSKACADVIMLDEHAKKLFDIAGYSLSKQGAIEPANMAEFRAKLIAAIHVEKMAEDEIEKQAIETNEPKKDTVSLEQRAYPLLKMLEHGEKANKPIYWGF